jgi:DNA-binding transcriptional regulator YdaS (Cro superfamily)
MTNVSRYGAAMTGYKLFSAWLKKKNVPQLTAARVLLVSPSAVSCWLSARRVPSAAWREAIERWTGGDVPASSWLTREERAIEAELARVAPFSSVQSEEDGA